MCENDQKKFVYLVQKKKIKNWEIEIRKWLKQESQNKCFGLKKL